MLSSFLSFQYRNWLLFSLLIFLVTSWFSLGYHQSDEHFQLLEFAGLQLGINTELDMAWEYHARMRPTLQASLVLGMHHLLAPLGLDSPFTVTWLFRLLSGLFSFGVMWGVFQVFSRRLELQNAHLHWAFFLLCFFMWFGFYNGVRYNSENWSGNTFMVAVLLLLHWEQPNTRQYFGLGLLVGLAFLFRFQIAICIAGLGLWLIFIKKEQPLSLLIFTLGGVLVGGLGVLVDSWFYGEWTISSWHYFEQTLLSNDSPDFGSSPWWKYFAEIVIQGHPPLGLIYLAALFYYIWRQPKSVLTWIVVPFIAVHMLIPHKELRFLFVLLPMVPVGVIYLLKSWQQGRSKLLPERTTYRWGWRLFWVHNAVVTLFIAFWPIIMEMRIYQTIYQQYSEPITLYGINDNPYRMALYINYYKRPHLCTAEVSELEKLPRYGHDTYLLAVDRRRDYDIAALPGQKTLVFSTYPSWIHFLNINGWMERSQWWLVYEVKPK